MTCARAIVELVRALRFYVVRRLHHGERARHHQGVDREGVKCRARERFRIYP